MKIQRVVYLFLCMLIHTLSAQDLALVDSADHRQSLYEQFKKDGTRQFTSHLNFQFCTSLTTSFNDFSLDNASFKLNRLRMEVLGRFFDRFSYHFRYSYNKYTNPNTVDELSTHVELANMGWDISKLFALKVGKQYFNLGGYEYYVSSIRVRHFSDFNNYTNAYLTGITGSFRFSPEQELNLQLLNNRVETESTIFTEEEAARIPKVPLTGSLNWNGKFMDNALQFYYSVAAGQILTNRNIYYLTFGNVWERGPILAYLDCMYSREEVDTKGLITGIHAVAEGEAQTTAQYAQYLSLIANFDYRLHPKWNMYVKGVYEIGGIYKDNRIYEKGNYRKTWNAQICLEYYPMKRNDLQVFLHLLYKQNNFTERAQRIGGENFSNQQIMLGMLYTIPVI